MIVLPFQHRELLACMLWGVSVYQLCSKGLITCYETPADWTAAVLYQFHIFDPEKGEDFTKKNTVAKITTPPLKIIYFKIIFLKKSITSLRCPRGQLFFMDLSILISAKSKVKGSVFFEAGYNRGMQVQGPDNWTLCIPCWCPTKSTPSTWFTGILFHKF